MGLDDMAQKSPKKARTGKHPGGAQKGVLTARMRKFAMEWLVCLHVEKAAVAAGYSPSFATSSAFILLKSPAVQAFIQAEQAAAAERNRLTIDMIIQELRLIAFARMGNYSRLEGSERFVDLSETTDEQLAAVSELQVDDIKSGRGDDSRDIRRTKIKLHDKRAALVDLGKHLGAFREQVDHNHTHRATFVIEK